MTTELQIPIKIICLTTVVLIGSYYSSHPEIIGQFYEKIVTGFIDAKN